MDKCLCFFAFNDDTIQFDLHSDERMRPMFLTLVKMDIAIITSTRWPILFTLLSRVFT